MHIHTHTHTVIMDQTRVLGLRMVFSRVGSFVEGFSDWAESIGSVSGDIRGCFEWF